MGRKAPIEADAELLPVGAEVEPVAEHPGKGNSINVSVPVDAEIGVSGGLSGLPYKHFEEFSNVNRFLNMT